MPEGRTSDPPRIPTRSEPTPFQRLLRRRAGLAAEWLVRSIEACGGQGSAVYYSRWFRPRRGWAPAYPETTGYIIPTLLDYSVYANRPELVELAIRQADWICGLQFDDGALPGGNIENWRRFGKSIFNTGQMLIGLIAAYDQTHRSSYLDVALRAAHWLTRTVDSQAGVWTSFAYRAGFSPAYYTRVAWPMLEVSVRTGDLDVRRAATRVLATIAGWQQPNGAVRDWGFAAKVPAFTHTIAYTIRGFVESARLLGDEGRPLFDVARKAAEALLRRMELRGRLAGAYDESLRGVHWYTCLTGNCQMALVWMRIGDALSDDRYLSAAVKVVEYVLRRQRVRSLDPNLRGAVGGSSPLWGRYVTMRYPNWAAKFLLDAAMEVDIRLGRALEAGPCASR